MLGPDRPGLTSSIGPDPKVAEHRAALASWRRRTAPDQAWAIWGDGGQFTPSVGPSTGKTRVGLWAPCLGLGGAEAWQLALVKGADGGRITWAGAAVIEGQGAVEPRMAAELAALMPVGFGLDSARKLAAACDVILSWAVVDVGLILSGLQPRPAVVMTSHFPGESPWGEGTAQLLRGVDQFVAVSELALEAMPPGLRFDSRVIWNAVDPDRLRVVRDRASIRAGWGVPAGVPVAGYLGRLAPEKDPGAMIRLAARLPEPWHAVLVGEGRERPGLERDAARFAPGRVHLVGGDSAAGDVLNAFDVLVVPSRYESFGLTLAEGLRSGTPVVATRTGLAKITAGLVREVSIGAPGRELAEAILADHAQPAETRIRVARGRAFALEHLGLDRFGREWTELLVEVAASRKEGEGCRSTPRVA